MTGNLSLIQDYSSLKMIFQDIVSTFPNDIQEIVRIQATSQKSPPFMLKRFSAFNGVQYVSLNDQEKVREFPMLDYMAVTWVGNSHE